MSQDAFRVRERDAAAASAGRDRKRLHKQLTPETDGTGPTGLRPSLGPVSRNSSGHRMKTFSLLLVKVGEL